MKRLEYEWDAQNNSRCKVQTAFSIFKNIFECGKVLKFGIPFFWECRFLFRPILIRFKLPFFSILSCVALV